MAVRKSTGGSGMASAAMRRGGRQKARAAAPPVAADERRGYAQLAEIQRARLLAATVRAVEELGYTNTTVAHITRRARVSRRTFYELFANREECLIAVLEDLIGQLQAELAALEIGELSWRVRVRTGLWAILTFFDREPQLARLCVVQALRGGPAVLERREQILARLAATIDEGRRESTRGAGLTSLTAEGLVGAAFTIIHARLLTRKASALAGLQGELMGMIVLPYLGAAAARREQTRPAPEPQARGSRKPVGAARVAVDPLDGVPMRLTYRTARVLEGVGEHPGASNRAVARHAGIADQGQVSKLLARLERLGLLVNAGEGHLKGEPNAWTLTSRGRQVARSVRMHVPAEEREAA
jgi:AcrR family transcriptional regulator/DNA-binding MarR family transcriptional regulator